MKRRTSKYQVVRVIFILVLILSLFALISLLQNKRSDIVITPYIENRVQTVYEPSELGSIMKNTLYLMKYEPSFDDIYEFIKTVNKSASRDVKITPISDTQIKRIIQAIEKYCVIYNVNKLTILAMASVESEYIINAKSYLGPQYGRGILQVSEIALADFNAWTGSNYMPEDLDIIEKNIEVGVWVFNQNYYYGVENDFENGAIIAYNVGVGDYKYHKIDLLNNQFKGNDYLYLSKVQEQYQEIFQKTVTRNLKAFNSVN